MPKSVRISLCVGSLYGGSLYGSVCTDQSVRISLCVGSLYGGSLYVCADLVASHPQHISRYCTFTCPTHIDSDAQHTVYTVTWIYTVT